MASRMLDLPPSPGPIRQLMPGDGSHANFLIDLKFEMLIARISVISPAFRLSRPNRLGAQLGPQQIYLRSDRLPVGMVLPKGGRID
jgi:hypothetical protein